MSSIKYNTANVLLERVAADWVDEVREKLNVEGGDPAYELLDDFNWPYALEQWAKNHDGGIDGAKLDLAHGLMFGYDVVDDNGRLEQKYVVSAPLPNREYLRLYLSADGTVMPLTTQMGEKYAPVVGGDHVLTHDEVAQLSNANMIARAFVITPVYLDVTSGKFHDDGAAAPILTVDTTDMEPEPDVNLDNLVLGSLVKAVESVPQNTEGER